MPEKLEASKDVVMQESKDVYMPQGIMTAARDVSGTKFRVMSYNLMSDKAVKERSVHLTEDNPCLKPEYRRRRIMSEISTSNSDILCLQEVSDYNDHFYREALEKLGYTIIKDHHKEQ